MKRKKRELKYLLKAIHLAEKGMKKGEGGPFGCVIVSEGRVIGRGHNRVTSSNDPTAHAEIVAIRQACKKLKSFQLEGCEIFTSCEPCPMCLGAIYWARPSAVYFASTKSAAADAGFDDAFIYDELKLIPEGRKIKMFHVPVEKAGEVFEKWKRMENKVKY